MTKDIIQLNDKAIGVVVPEDAQNFLVNGNQLSYEYDVIEAKTGSRQGWIGCPELPEGNWTILGLAKDLTEDQWKEVVESGVCNDSGEHGCGFFRYYREYPYHLEERAGFSTAKESGYSLLKSLSLDPETTLILIKQ